MGAPLFFTFFIATTYVALGMAQEAPRPFLKLPIVAGAKKIQGQFETVKVGTVPTFQLFVNGAPRSIQTTVILERSEFTLSFDEGLDPKDEGEVRMHLSGVSIGIRRFVAEEAPKTPEIEWRSIEAIYGTSKTAATLKPFEDPPEKLTAKISIGGRRELPLELDRKALMIGAIEIDLGGPVLPNDLEPENVSIIQTGAGPFNMLTSRIQAATVVLSLPREGDFSVKGKAHKSVKRVCVAILGGAFGGGMAQEHTDYNSALFPPRTCGQAARLKAAEDSRLLYTNLNSSYSTDPAFLGFLGDRIKALRDVEIPNKPVPGSPAAHLIPSNHVLSLDPVALRNQVADLVGELLDEKEVAVDEKTGDFEAHLENPLDAQSRVMVRQVFESSVGSLVSPYGPPVLAARSVGLDWGRVSGVFVAGATLSQSQDSFAKADPYLSLTFDANWANHLLDKADGILNQPNAKIQASESFASAIRSLFGTRQFGWAIHSLAEVRLTQNGTISGLGASPNFLQPAQAAFFQAGLYLPMRLKGMDWVYGGQQYSSYFAPLFKAGMTSVSDGIVLAETKVTKVTQPEPGFPGDPRTETSVEQELARGPAPFLAYGMRLGVMRYSLLGGERRNRQVAPDPQLYIDIAWGENQAYPTPGITGPPVISESGRVRTSSVRTGSTFETRLSVEARAKLPYIPVQLGVDINRNWRAPVRAVDGTPASNLRYSDFRFLIGFRLNLAKSLYTIFKPATK